MSPPIELPTGLLARSALPMVREYAQGQHREELDTEDFLSALAEKTQAEMDEEALAERWTEAGFGVAAALNPWALTFEITRAIFGRDLVCEILVVNDLPEPLRLELPSGLDVPYQVHGEIVSIPMVPSSPPRRHEIPGRAGAFCGMGIYTFHKWTFWGGIGTAGTSGVLQFQRVPGVLEQGLRVGWDVPFKLNSTNDCAVSFERRGTARQWFDAELDGKRLGEFSAQGDGVRAMCAQNHRTGPRSLLTVLVEEHA